MSVFVMIGSLVLHAIGAWSGASGSVFPRNADVMELSVDRDVIVLLEVEARNCAIRSVVNLAG